MVERVERTEEKPREEPPSTGAGHSCQVCGIKLSGYNPGPNCWQHTIGYPWRGPTAKPKF